MEDGIRLMDATEQEPGESAMERQALGIELVSQEQREVPVHGVWVGGELDLAVLMPLIACLCTSEPLLVLVVGERVPYGFAARVQDTCQAGRVEVVRFLLLDGGERAVLGGDPQGWWLIRLRRRLADAGILSLVCRYVEADEAARFLPLYLEWKQRFYLEMGGRCDQSGARLEVVAQALGMDKRIGQGWLFPGAGGAAQEREIAGWLREQWTFVKQKTNVSRIAFWGAPSVLRAVLPQEKAGERICLYIPAQTEKPNDLPVIWRTCADPLETLDDADVLMIAGADRLVRELALTQLVFRMRQPVVIDACSCYPLQEAEAFAIRYRSFGQNTNVWNGSDYNRV